MALRADKGSLESQNDTIALRICLLGDFDLVNSQREIPQKGGKYLYFAITHAHDPVATLEIINRLNKAELAGVLSRE